MNGPGSGITLFTTMKPFYGEAARIQRNSIKSWLALKPCPEIIVFGDDPGVPEACREFGLALVPKVERALSGLPYLDDLFGQAQRLASNLVVCYVNADILLTSDLLTALHAVSRRLGSAVMICAPHNLPIPYELRTSDPCWEQSLRASVSWKGPGPTPYGADIFMFPKGFYKRLPRLIIGRGRWDNMLIWRACFGNLPAVDLTYAVLAVHQHHDQTWHPGSSGNGPVQIVSDADTEWNSTHTPWWQQRCRRTDLPFILCPDGTLARRSTIPRVAVLAAVTDRHLDILDRTLHIRRRLGLYRWWRH